MSASSTAATPQLSPPPWRGSSPEPPSALAVWLTARPAGPSNVAVAVACAALIGLVGVADLLTGFEISVSIFYLLPVAIAAWYLGRTAATAAAIGAAATLLLVERVAGVVYSHAAIPFWNAAVLLGFFLVTGWLLTALRVHLEQERALARTDPLTGTMNGRAFQEEGRLLLQLAGRMERPITVLFIDADGFKGVNDSLGHSAGDRVLETVGRTLREGVRGTDLVARLGGDEFAILCPGLDGEHTAGVAAKVRRALQEAMERGGWPVSFSVGAATFPRPPSSLDEAIAAADSLMYLAKESGRDRVVHSVVSEGGVAATKGGAASG